jgi:hypothetical protein
VAGNVLTTVIDGKTEKLTFTVRGSELDLIKAGKDEILHLKR